MTTIKVNTGHIKNQFRYRLYSDGTIMDQHTNTIAGHILSKIELDEIYAIRSLKEQQKRLLDYIN